MAATDKTASKPAAKPAPKPAVPVVKKSSSGLPLLLTFILTSVTIAIVCMYTYRIDWAAVKKAGGGDLQAGFKEWSRQAQVLVEDDHSAFVAKKEELTIRAMDEYAKRSGQFHEFAESVKEMLGQQPRGLGSPPRPGPGTPTPKPTPTVPGEECQAAINGFENDFLNPSRTFNTTASEDHQSALIFFLTDLSNVHQRWKSVTYLAEYSQDQGATETAKEAMLKFGCDGPLKGQCVLVDFELLAEHEDQGAALQALAAPALKESPSTLFFMINIENLDPSGAAVLLALIGEHGVLNEPGCDISTQASAALILAPVDMDDGPDPAGTLEEFEATIKEALADHDDSSNEETQMTAAAVRRRVDNSVLRLKYIGAKSAFGDIADKMAKEKQIPSGSRPSDEELAAAAAKRKELEARREAGEDIEELSRQGREQVHEEL